MPANRGILSGIKPLSDVPDWAGGGDPANDGMALGFDTSKAGGISPTGYALSFFGDGSDGAQTFDGTTTILSVAPSSSTYSLARDIFLSSGTINPGVTIISNGFRIFCSGTLTNNGTIKWNGASASGATAGTLTANANASINLGTVGSAGSSGGITTGTNGQNSPSRSLGGASGAGGAGSSGSGGTAGSALAAPTTHGSLRSAPTAILGVFLGGIDLTGSQGTSSGGAGGGGGGGDSIHSGGAGGAGGGTVIVIARFIAGTGAIQARGGDGANGVAGNAGGGGGGGGGYVIVVSSSVSNGAVAGQTIDAAGGAKGLKVGTGSDGNAGSNGTTIVLAA